MLMLYVLWSSSSAAPAICEGKPLYIKSKNCFFYNMNSGDIKDIENPKIKDNRQEWFLNYAATHHNLKDLSVFFQESFHTNLEL